MSTSEIKQVKTKHPIGIYYISHDQYGIADIRTGVNITDGWCIGLCLKGSITVYINETPVNLTPNTIFITHPQQVITAQDGSLDLQIKVLYLSTDTLQQILLHADILTLHKNIRSFEYKRIVKDVFPELDYPTHYINVTEQLCHDIDSIFEILSHRLPKKEEITDTNPTVVDIVLVKSVITLIFEYAKNHPPIPKAQTHKEKITREFISQLFENPADIQELDYYAAQLCISSKYLSTIIRQTTKMTAQEWIMRVTLFNAKQLLLNSNLGIAEIADQLKFSTASTFIRFFRNRTELTPKAFRDRQQ